MIFRLLSFGVRKQAKKRKVSFSFLFMRADGRQLGLITELIDSGAIRPVVDRAFSFDEINEALAYVEKGRAKGKVVVRMQ